LEQNSDVKVLKEAPESGLVAGYAAGVPHANYEHLFFCNEDVWLAADCLRLLEQQIDLVQKVACADPWQCSYDGAEIVHTGPQVHRGWSHRSPHPRYMLSQNKSIPCGHVVAQASAGAMMIHKFAYNDVGGWDRTFFLDHEDTELAIRLWQRDWLTVVVPEAKVYHAIGASNDKIIPGRRLPVSKMRYVGSSSNQLVVAWKLFSASYWTLPLLGWGENLGRNLLKGRWRLAGLDFLALKSALSRITSIARFRRQNRRQIRLRPGERFFLEPRFQFGALFRPKDDLG
jgi:GT2 family glycosyltransferase